MNKHCFVLIITLTATSTTSSAFGPGLPSPVASQPAAAVRESFPKDSRIVDLSEEVAKRLDAAPAPR